MERNEFIKVQIEKVVKLLLYKIDVEVKPIDKDDEVEVILIYYKPVKRIKIEMELK